MKGRFGQLQFSEGMTRIRRVRLDDFGGLFFIGDPKDRPPMTASDMDMARIVDGAILPFYRVSNMVGSPSVEVATQHAYMLPPGPNWPETPMLETFLTSKFGSFVYYTNGSTVNFFSYSPFPVTPTTRVVLRSVLGVLFCCASGHQPRYWNEQHNRWDVPEGLVDAYADVVAYADRGIFINPHFMLGKIAFSVSGDPRDADGVGSGEILLTPSPGRAVDAPRAIVDLGSFAAIIRQFSISRLYRTGSVALPIGIAPWISQIGSESTQSVCQADNGALFVGSDFMPYYITDSGVTPIGTTIAWWLKENLSWASLIDCRGFYDQLDGVWYLMVFSNKENKRYVLTFDLRAFLRNNREVWGKHSLDFLGMGVVSPAIFQPFLTYGPPEIFGMNGGSYLLRVDRGPIVVAPASTVTYTTNPLYFEEKKPVTIRRFIVETEGAAGNTSIEVYALTESEEIFLGTAYPDPGSSGVQAVPLSPPTGGFPLVSGKSIRIKLVWKNPPTVDSKISGIIMDLVERSHTTHF